MRGRAYGYSLYLTSTSGQEELAGLVLDHDTKINATAAPWGLLSKLTTRRLRNCVRVKVQFPGNDEQTWDRSNKVIEPSIERNVQAEQAPPAYGLLDPDTERHTHKQKEHCKCTGWKRKLKGAHKQKKRHHHNGAGQ
jgi:hypothetical protein